MENHIVNMSQDTSALNELLRTTARCSHLFSDISDFTLNALLSRQSFACSQSNFGRKRHSFYFTQKSNNAKENTASPIEKDLSRVSHLRSDTQDYVLACLFSSVTLQTPAKNLSPTVHPFIQIRKTVKSTSKKSSGSGLNKPPTTLSETQITNLALRTKLLHGKKTTPKFSELFPQTTWPQVTLVQGHPRIDRSIFNSLLLSKIRSLKAEIGKEHTVPKSLSKNLILRFSRMIDLSLSIELTQRKADHPKAPVPRPSRKAQAKRTTISPLIPTGSLKDKFTSATPAVDTLDDNPSHVYVNSSTQTDPPRTHEPHTPHSSFFNSWKHMKPHDRIRLFRLLPGQRYSTERLTSGTFSDFHALPLAPQTLHEDSIVDAVLTFEDVLGSLYTVERPNYHVSGPYVANPVLPLYFEPNYTETTLVLRPYFWTDTGIEYNLDSQYEIRVTETFKQLLAGSAQVDSSEPMECIDQSRITRFTQ
jgi:hypothetical protein